MKHLIKEEKVLAFIRIIAAVILLQTLFFKFTGAPESIYIFSRLQMEPWGRIGIGVLELIASILILWNRTVLWGAILAAGVMAGAIFFHLTSLGIVVQNDHGKLFALALIVLICSLALVYSYRKQLIKIVESIKKQSF